MNVLSLIPGLEALVERRLYVRDVNARRGAIHRYVDGAEPVPCAAAVYGGQPGDVARHWTPGEMPDDAVPHILYLAKIPDFRIMSPPVVGVERTGTLYRVHTGDRREPDIVRFRVRHPGFAAELDDLARRFQQV